MVFLYYWFESSFTFYSMEVQTVHVHKHKKSIEKEFAF